MWDRPNEPKITLYRHLNEAYKQKNPRQATPYLYVKKWFRTRARAGVHMVVLFRRNIEMNTNDVIKTTKDTKKFHRSQNTKPCGQKT